MTKDEVLAQGIQFFIAGYETTATTIAFLLYNLALYPEIQGKVNDEIMQAAPGDIEVRNNDLYYHTVM